MNLEFLANELILDIFEYFDSVQLLRAFHGLNIRLNELLHLYFQTHSLDFRSISKRNFDDVCQNILPLLTDHITSIHLSNDDDTPDEPNLFYTFGFHFQQFTKLKSLSLYYIRSIDLINRMLSECPHLISLHISKCNFNDDKETAEACAMTIWSLSKLQYCYLDIESWIHFNTQRSNVISTSLQVLSIEHDLISFDCLHSLVRCTPNLQHLTIGLREISDNEHRLSFKMSSLTKLKLYFEGAFHNLRNLLSSLSSLTELIIQTNHLWIDGYQWEEMIIGYFPQLRIFRLLMFDTISAEKNIDDETNYLIESFQTKFWLEERQWFVRCDYHNESRVTYLYTLPYGFRKFHRLASDMCKSTCPRRADLFNHVNTLILDYDLIRFASRFPLQFSNIHHLDLSYPFDDVIWSILPKLDRLRYLEILSIAHPDRNYRPIAHLRRLLTQARYLYSLTIDYLVLSELSSTPITNKSIRRLDLITSDGHFYGSECIPLIHSLLGNQCEILSVNIEHRSIAIDLIEKMPNLRALTFLCQADQWDDSHESLLTEDELIPWLKHRLPSNCLVLRDENDLSVIQVWLC